jgi:hypothetical protein
MDIIEDTKFLTIQQKEYEASCGIHKIKPKKFNSAWNIGLRDTA